MKLIDYHFYLNSATELILEVKEHTHEGIEVVVYNYPDYVGFKCKKCDISWGMKSKYLRKKDENNYIFSSPDKMEEFAKNINRVLDVDTMFSKYGRSYINYSALVEVGLVTTDDFIYDWNKLSDNEKDRVLCRIRDIILKRYPIVHQCGCKEKCSTDKKMSDGIREI